MILILFGIIVLLCIGHYFIRRPKQTKVIDVDYVDVKQKIANIRSYNVSKN